MFDAVVIEGDVDSGVQSFNRLLFFVYWSMFWSG